MGVVVGLLEARGRQVRVDLRRRERLVAEKLLDAAQVRPVVEHVRGEAVPQGVGADARIESGLGQILIQLAANAPRAEPLPVLVDEEGVLIEPGGTGVGTVRCESRGRPAVRT